ncbi:hypothetical protein E5F05_00385 (plasmid) [Deinococcus metallilatus]|uniref:Uncharacterized protein n=1 Tax=Deinococcus metallilatus TaxID=1211322 RepID=A0AAJ5F795_9DEIO|nr:hypothetical protein [Deinococcus metallilatus]MBB5293355.1 hypothetical protein [Deinococcus metallilatus]QBY06461.1 hypothetical protein E5F05_00385 [Deinococcus metallilatus]RXJ18140.1 hypothetical protein ERJ73_01900 [Deinococcus metallilatus]TLK32076.1 hypothetical protein FCS05_01015 [Deinococcus metallilatus]GMA15422.1 hypothetical protein GCM10025871_17530 [Deinococcus metallilatus]
MNHVQLLAPLVLALGTASAAPTVLNLTATGQGYAGPATVQAGYVQVNLQNTSGMPVDVGVFRLKPGVTEAQFRAAGTAVATMAAKDADYNLGQMVDVLGGVGDVQPGKSDSAVLHLPPGTYILASLDADEATHKTALSLGYEKPLTVTGPELSNAPAGADYTVNMVDYRFVLPTNVTAGPHTWHVMNSGQEPHFALLARLLPGKTMQDVMNAIMSSDQSGPPPVDFEHSVFAQVLTTGQAEDVTWNLTPGQYAVVCFVASKNGMEHARMGMLQELTVK